jgi:hypothetical protein
MMLEIDILRAVKITIVLLGLVLVYLAAKSYRQNGKTEMAFLSAGFAFIAVGSVAAGLLFEFIGLTLTQVSIVEGIMIVMGFLLIIYAIYGFD